MRVFQMQRISAIAVVVFLTIHMIVTHYPPFHIDFSRILERMANPVWKGIDIVFLFFVLMHALTGAYMVLTDSERLYRYRKPLQWAALVVFAIAMWYGTKTILAFQPPSAAMLVPTP
jgi:succinate dehydrogenase / fumarate reductase membrane anchor subunit